MDKLDHRGGSNRGGNRVCRCGENNNSYRGNVKAIRTGQELRRIDFINIDLGHRIKAASSENHEHRQS